MADKVILEAEVKSNIGEVSKDAGSLAGEFKVMGVSLNGIKSSMGKIIPAAKAMFGSIKAGIMSTGIGALLIAFGSLATYFTSTKEGADKLDRAFKAIGTTIDVLKDRMSDVGEAISLVFQGKWSEAADKLKESVTGIVEEVTKEVKIMDDLEIRLQKLRDAELAFSVQKAATRQEIEKARLIAEDETKSAKERLDNLKKALELEEKTTQRELELAREKVAIQDEQMLTSKNLVEDEARLAQFRVELIEKETASVKMRRRVVTEVNSLEREILAEEKARAKEKQDLIDAENKRLADIQKKADEEQAAAEKLAADKKIAEAKRAADEEVRILKEAEATKAAVRDANIANIEAGIGLVKSLAGENKQIQAAALVAENAAGIAKTIISTQSANAGALATPQAILTSGASAVPVIAANNVAAGLSIAASVAATAKGLAALGGGGSAGGGGASNLPAGGGSAGSATQTPAPQMMSGAFELSGGVEPEPLRAFVITDEMTSSQNQLANIRRRATI